MEAVYKSSVETVASGRGTNPVRPAVAWGMQGSGGRGGKHTGLVTRNCLPSSLPKPLTLVYFKD